MMNGGSAHAVDYANSDTDVFEDQTVPGPECRTADALLATSHSALLNPSVTYRAPYPMEPTDPTVPRDRPGLPELPQLRIGAPSTHAVDLTLEHKVGSGGIGVVEAATQVCLGRRVAIKRVRPDRRGAMTEALLRKEAHLMARLEHPVIPPVHMLGRDGDERPVLVMKLVDGQSWETLLQKDHKKPGQALSSRCLRKHLNILLRIGDALSFAHAEGIIHCDIKPENVIIGEHGQVYLLDWGIAAQLNGQGKRQSRGFAGTPIYAAPEMVSPRPTLTIHTDIYLLGATLFHLLQGRAPHTGSDVSAVLASLQRDPTPRLAGVPEALVLICNKAMARRPEDRHDSIEAMLSALRFYLDHSDMIEVHQQASSSLERLEELASIGSLNSEEFEFLGYGCRYTLERVSQAWPEDTVVRDQLARCVLLLCDSAIEQRRIAAARALLNQYSIVTGTEHPDQPWSWASTTGTGDAVLARALRINTLAEQAISRSDELSMSIQVRLVERLTAQKAAYDELLAAYRALEQERPTNAST